MNKKIKGAITALLLLAIASSCKQKEPQNTVENNKAVSKEFETKSDLVVDFSDTGIVIQPTMYGVFFEDINFGADGGIYAELIKNRSFEFPNPKMGWHEPNSVRYSLNGDSGFAKVTDYVNGKGNKRYVHVMVENDQRYELYNEGFRGIGVKADAKYDLSLSLAKNKGITQISVALLDTTNTVVGQTNIIPKEHEEWQTYTATLQPNKTVAKGKLKITFSGKGSIDMDLVSLFPQETWKGRKKGLRKDLVTLLDGLNPGFVRFPGGCIVEGMNLDNRYQWKKTVGTWDQRELMINRWNIEFPNKNAPDYFQSFGLGFFEYFQLSEDLDAEPLPILGCGMACQFNSGELVPLEDLDPYVQDALDLIEFANGSTNTKWGSLRKEMGHPEPFQMKYIGIGNEQWGPEYFERYKVFAAILAEKHPEITVVSTPGPFPDGDMFEYGWEQLNELDVALVDEHYYKSPEWFLENADRYDSYDRNGPKVFAGEYAAHPKDKDGIVENNWQAALAEAAFMTGLERNADLVHLTSYAPLMAHADAWQWAPDLIWFNNLEAVPTPNYQVQKLFSNNPGTNLIGITKNDKPLTGQNNLYASAVIDSNTQEVIFKIVNTASQAQEVNIKLKGQDVVAKGTKTVLTSDGLEEINSFENPNNIVPQVEEITAKEDMVQLQLAPRSLNVVKFKIK